MSCVANTIWTVKVLRGMFLLVLLALLSQPSAMAVQSVLLTWNPSQVTGVVGYKVYSGATSQNYTSVIDVGNATNVTIPALLDGSTNYFSATTYDASTNESVHSAEVVFVVPAVTPPDTNNSVTNVVVDPPLTNSTPTNPPTLHTVANLMVTTNPADASSVIVTWDASTDAGVTGYQVFFGAASGNYPNVTNLGLVNSLVVTGLIAGVTNFFAVREYDSAWNESPMSAEVSYALPLPAKLPPTLSAISDMSINMNTSWQTLTLTGIAAGFPSRSNAVIKVTAASSNTNLIANPKITYTSPRSTAVMKFKPVPGASGVTSITVTVDDGGASNNITSQTFNVTVINTIRLAALPKIVLQPVGKTVLPGRTAQLTVVMTGRAPFHFQWMRNGTNVPGATSQTLTFRNFSTNQAGVYSVLVWNSWGSTNSATAELALPVPTNAAPAQTTFASSNVVAPSIRLAPASAVAPADTTPIMSTPIRTNGQFSFQVTGLAGATYVVLATEDLKNWSPVQTNTAPFTYTETNASGYSKRFYRALYQP